MSAFTVRSAIRMGTSKASSSRNPSLTAASRLSAVQSHLTASRRMSSTPASPLDSDIEYRTEGSARIYRLRRDKALNSLNHGMIASLADKLHVWRESEQCKMILGMGGERAFCAGGDVKQLIMDVREDKQTALPFFKDEFQVNWLMAKLGKPYVAVIDGIIMGGGCGIALPAPIRIATSKTHFAMPETKIGYAPDVGVNYYLAQLDGAVGAWLAITGQDIYGRAVYELGLATHYVSAAALPDIIQQLTSLDDPTLPKLSLIIAAYNPPPPADAGPSSTKVSSKHHPDGPTLVTGEIRRFLDKTFGQDSVKKIYDDLSAAQSNDELSAQVKHWAGEQRILLEHRSPTGMAVALEGFRRARKAKRLDVVLDNDMSMATAFSGPDRPTDDFITGVTAVLVDKVKTRPAWSPSDISDPTLAQKSIAQAFFSPSSSSHLKAKPSLDLQPASSSPMSDPRDSTWGHFRRYGLPSEAEVRGAIEGTSPESGAFKITKAELMERLVDARGDTAGPRQKEVEGVIERIVEERCGEREGYLDWKR